MELHAATWEHLEQHAAGMVACLWHGRAAACETRPDGTAYLMGVDYLTVAAAPVKGSFAQLASLHCACDAALGAGWACWD